MKDTKLANLLKTLTPEEFISFGKFIASPFFNSVKSYTKLIKELVKFYPEFESDKLTYENLYKKLYPGKKFNKQVMWNQFSAMEKMARDFLEQIALRKNKFNRMELLISEFGSRKLLKDYSYILDKMEKLLESNAIDHTYFENKEHLENFKQVYYFLQHKHQSMSDSKLKAAEY